ncbi:TonB-dependent siderophore receptor [Salinimonas sediminis]|uniref:TonB-dependent receptor n=1 Tax=Salinimonas sediminis TaxID=2303538 RepID=A0A346NIK8_9ALTE|nr:TonB-dependent receptor [Salinimonas sediminis]AXR05365.1 TonB-dependent receptor [Salinimonas sediminis]
MYSRPYIAYATLPLSLCAGFSVYAQQPEPAIENIQVLGRAQQYYLDTSTRVGTKTDADVMQIPLSVQVLSRQLINDQAARDITDMYRSIAGVSEFSYSGITFRGFRDDGNVFYDGVRGDPFSGFGVPQLFNVERVEVLKGPAASLYGGGEPGGMINYVSRKPAFTDQQEVKLTVGNYSLGGASFDSTGSLSDTLAYRFGAFYEAQDSFRYNADAENIELAGGLTYLISDNTTLTTTYDFIKQNLGGNRLRGVPVDDEGNFLVSRRYNANEAGDFQNLEALVLQANVVHHFTDSLKVNTTLRYLNNEREQAYHESREWVDVNLDGVADINDQTIKREYRAQYRANDEVSLTVDFTYDFVLAGLQHNLLFGGDMHDVDTDYDYYRARYEADGVANLNIFSLNYGLTDPATYNLTNQNRDGLTRTRSSLYVQDTLALAPQWSLMIGARWDYFDEQSKENSGAYTDSNVSPRVGLSYFASADSTVYINHSQSFNPVDTQDQEVAGIVSLAPETGDQIELGIKQSWLDGALMTTLAYYQIDKENLVMANPAFIDGENNASEPALINFGKVESEGAEFTLVGDLTAALSVTANYAYNETVVAEGDAGNTFGVGERFANAPKHQAGIWTRYAFSSLHSAVALGADYVTEQRSLDNQKVKSYVVWDASWTTQWQQWTLQLNIKNLFDKHYAVSGFSRRNGHFPGEPREVVAEASYRF